MSEVMSGLPIGDRIRLARERAGMTRPVLAGLLGRSVDWLRFIETGRRKPPGLSTLVAIARTLGVSDLSELTGEPLAATIDRRGRVSHPYVVQLREAVQAPLFGQRMPFGETLDILAGRVEQAWLIWHSSPHNRTEVGRVLPDLLSACQAALRTTEGDERRKAQRISASAYGLGQMFAAHTTEPSLYWVTVDRARTAAEASDDPARLGLAAWVMANGLSPQLQYEECIRILSDAANALKPMLEEGSNELRAVYGSICLKAAITYALDGKDGPAWGWWDKANETANKLGGYWHPETAFSPGNVAVHAVTMGTELHQTGQAMSKVAETNPDLIPSLERRSRLYVDAARSQWQRKETGGALHYIKEAFELSPECVRYVPPARALVEELSVKATGADKRAAVALADEVGVLAGATWHQPE